MELFVIRVAYYFYLLLAAMVLSMVWTVVMVMDRVSLEKLLFVT